MQFKEIRIMRGPNMWSRKNNHVLAVKYETITQQNIPIDDRNIIKENFGKKYQLKTPYEDFDLSIFHFILQLAAKLQGEDFHHDIVEPSHEIIFGVVEYKVEEAGLAAINIALNILESVLEDRDPPNFHEATESIALLSRRYGNGPSTKIIVDAALERNIPVNKGPAGYTLLGYGKKQQRISAAMSDQTSCISVNISCNKEATKKFLQNSNLPVPQGTLSENENDLMTIAENLGYPLVTKPYNGNQGRNITCNITNFENLLTGFRYAKLLSDRVIVEKEIQGQDFRMLVVGNKMVAASLRLPACVIGDGVLCVEDLISKENNNPKRGEGHENVLTKIKIDAATELCLQSQNLEFTSVPNSGQTVFLKSTANLSTGGTAEDVTDLVHPANKRLVEKASKIIGLNICGIDIISPDISIPWTENGAAIIEVNAAPGLRMHQYPSKGLPREVGNPIIDLLYNKNENGRIPIVAVTGTNGKTTTTRLMAQIASYSGLTVGFSSTDGIYVDGEKIQTGDCSGPQSAKTILQDPTVEFAVLESARGGIIRSGLGFDQCDIAIVTNVAADHLGLKDVHTVEDLAFVKSVVPSTVKPDGWAILNAADQYSFGMKKALECNVALFCKEENNENIIAHLSNGGTAICTDKDLNIHIYHQNKKTFVFNAAEAPITCGGKAGFMIDNLLPSVLASYLLGFELEKITQALLGFIPSAENTPGRINEFKINKVNVIVDYAHNPHGLRALAGYIKNIPERKVGIITGTGDRREEDIIEFGKIAGGMFDEIIIRFDRDLRGRTRESIIELLDKGIREADPVKTYQIVPETQSAIYYAIENAPENSYVIVCADNATYTLGLVKNVANAFGEVL